MSPGPSRSMAMLLLLASGCANPSPRSPDPSNPFLEDQSNHARADTAYYNPDGIEVEVDLEGDIEAGTADPGRAPALLAQFAQTALRNRHAFYLQSVADAASASGRTEWLVDGAWLAADRANKVGRASLTHFRLRGINAVLLHEVASGVRQGDTFKAKVPLKPFSLYHDAGSSCADANVHVTLDQAVYWYLWNPSLPACRAAVQDLKLTVSRLAPQAVTTYPEYDQLVQDGKVTAVMLFGKVDSGPLTESDPGMVQLRTMAGWLRESGFAEVPDAPVGQRFSKRVGEVDLEVDLYSPSDFAGLGDYENLLNFDTAVTEHEIVIFQGHSLLGASDLWGNQRYPASYQIFLYGGCLGYEYYVNPILKAKGGWNHLDLVSSATPVPAEDEPGAAFVAKLAWSLGHGYAASWRDLLGAISHRLGTSTFGVSGVRDNAYSPAGASTRHEHDAAVAIPDGDEAGVSSVIHVPELLAAKSVTLELDVSHESISDLTFSLEHGGTPVVFWDQQDEGDTIREGFTLDAFAGQQAQGTWTLHVTDHWQLYSGRANRWALILEH